jgi:hypothetical protein
MKIFQGGGFKTRPYSPGIFTEKISWSADEYGQEVHIL